MKRQAGQDINNEINDNIEQKENKIQKRPDFNREIEQLFTQDTIDDEALFQAIIENNNLYVSTINNLEDTEGNLLLHHAITKGSLEIVKILLEGKADVEAKNEKGFTPLHIAAENGHAEITRLLLQYRADVEAQSDNKSDEDKYTPLHIAAENGHAEIIEILLSHDASPEAKSENGSTPLHIAAYYGHAEAAKVLLSHDAKPEVVDLGMSTPLHFAGRTGSLELVEALLQHGANPNAKDDEKSTPLHIAATYGNTEAVKALLQHGANPNAKDDAKSTPLHIAAKYGNAEAVKALLQHGANLNAKDYEKSTPLHIAATYGNTEAVKALLQHGANPNAKDDAKSTPLYIAAKYGDGEIAEALLQHGAILHGKNEYSLLHTAVRNGKAKVVKVLLSHNANIEGRDKEGLTPLYLAARYKQPEVVKILLERGANIEKLANFIPIEPNENSDEVVKLLSYAKLVESLCTEYYSIAIEDKSKDSMELLFNESNEIKNLFTQRILNKIISSYDNVNESNKLQKALETVHNVLTYNLSIIEKGLPEIDLSFLSTAVTKISGSSDSFLSLFRLSALHVLKSGTYEKISTLPSDCKEKIKDVSEIFGASVSEDIKSALAQTERSVNSITQEDMDCNQVTELLPIIGSTNMEM